jgi:cephalosporin-C deacetylase-like acetyl esterase
MKRAAPFIFILLGLAAVPRDCCQSADPQARQQFLHFIKAQAAELRTKDRAPATRGEWEARQVELRRHLRKAWGPWPEKPCPLEPRVLGVLKRDSYRVEKLLFQTMHSVWMTANAYVPERKGKLPAILMVHGHWAKARVDPVVQSRCIGAAKLGYFVLVVDAFGAGERSIGKQPEYHGEMVAATLWPVGLPLSGLQVYENMRAVDYLLTRPEVDGSRLGITGASGGGNQTMYAGSWDRRFSAAVPVCSVGNYQAYLGAACCMCEVVPGALRFTEEWGILGMTAPRGLMVINATRDARQFSVDEAKKSLALASSVYRLFNQPDGVRHTIFESGHDYSQAMREAMYGWMALHLRGEGDGRPIPEPNFKTEDPEVLRCFPGESRPADWMTLPRFAAAEGKKLLVGRAVPNRPETWALEAKVRRKALLENVLGGMPTRTPLGLKVIAAEDGSGRTLAFQPEPGLTLTARQITPGARAANVAILLNLDGAARAAEDPLATQLKDSGWGLITIDLRATGELAPPGDTVGRAPDHNTAEWSLWLGRPLLGQWAWDVSRLLDALAEADGKLPGRLAVIGRGPAGLVALSAAAVDDRISALASVDSLASYVSDVPYKSQRLGVMAPAILREVGDVAHLTALCAPRRVVIAGGVLGSGEQITADQRQQLFTFSRRIWGLMGAEKGFRLVSSNSLSEITDGLK